MPSIPSFSVSNQLTNVALEQNEQTLDELNDDNQNDDGVSIVTPSSDTNDVQPVQQIPSQVEPTMGYFDEKRSSKLVDVYGSPSIFNKNALFVYPASSTSNGFKKFYDVSGQENLFLFETPTTQKIVEESKGKSSKDTTDTELLMADFVYCKHHKFIPNNRLLVLRRYPFATYNNLVFPFNEKVSQLAKGVTYFGEGTGNDLSEIIKITGYKNYKELEADLNIITSQGQNKGLNSSPFASANGTANKFLKGFSAVSGKGDASGRERVKIEAMAGKNWENERKGQENVIHKTNIADVGVGANLEFKLVFEYELRSFNGINPRVAMMDLLANLMTLVHINAEFWGGQNIVLPNPDTTQFPFIGDQDAFYRGDYGNYLGSVVDWFSEPFKSGGGLSGLIDGIMSGDFGSLGDLLGKAGATVLDLSSSKSRSSVVGMKALLDANPIGNYHLTVGNPLHPIAKIGNLICPSFTLTPSDELGYNDYPTSIKLEVDLKTATPLDSTGVQGLFANGLVTNRMYMKPVDFLDATGVVDNGGKGMTPDDIDRANGVVY